MKLGIFIINRCQFEFNFILYFIVTGYKPETVKLNLNIVIIGKIELQVLKLEKW